MFVSLFSETITSEDLDGSRPNTDNSLANSTSEQAPTVAKENSALFIRQTVRESISYTHLSF